MTRSSGNGKFYFFMESGHYRKLQLVVYLSTLLVLLSLFLIIRYLFPEPKNLGEIVGGAISLALGIYLVFKREKIIKWLSEEIHEMRRKELKKETEKSKESAMKRIVPKHRGLTFNIGGKVAFKEKWQNLKDKLGGKKKKKEEYIEYK
jgi:hypothetical protein